MKYSSNKVGNHRNAGRRVQFDETPVQTRTKVVEDSVGLKAETAKYGNGMKAEQIS